MLLAGKTAAISGAASARGIGPAGGRVSYWQAGKQSNRLLTRT